MKKQDIEIIYLYYYTAPIFNFLFNTIL